VYEKVEPSERDLILTPDGRKDSKKDSSRQRGSEPRYGVLKKSATQEVGLLKWQVETPGRDGSNLLLLLLLC